MELMPELDLQLSANIRGDTAEAWRLSEIMWERDSSDNRVAFNRGWHVLSQGDLQGGMALIDRGRWIRVFGSPPLTSTRPLYDPRKHNIEGRTVLLRGEGGLGDEIVNVRFAREFVKKGAKVVVSSNPGLAPLFARMKSVSAVVQAGLELGVYHDYWIPGMSAVRFTGNTYDTLDGSPYLRPNPFRVSRWRPLVEGVKDLKVGIRWSGNPQFEHEQHRRFPVEPIFDLQDIPGVKLYSFQRDDNLTELSSAITDLNIFLFDWEDTAAALSQMDLLITSCTSVAHLSAAMGIETWVIVPILPYYVWALPGDRSPWYNSVRLFRQTTFGDWSEPMENIRSALVERAETER